MDGATKMETRKGIIVATNATLNFDKDETLKEQYLATYKSNGGDSGAPVYTNEGILIGLNVGKVKREDVDVDVNFDFSGESYAIISKWNNIINDLGFRNH